MNKRFAKIISLMLVLVMVLGVVPGSVFAGPQYNDGTNGFGDLIRNWWEIIVRPLPWYKPTPNYPAQSFGGDDLGGLYVNVEAPAGALPEGTEMYVERVYNTTNIQTAVDNSDLVNGDVIAAVDITFYHNGAEFQPGSDVKVTLSYAGFDGCDDLSVVHIGASAEEVVNEVPFVDPVEDVESDGETVSFDARDFSIYAVVGDNETGDRARLTVEFYNGTQLIQTAIVTKAGISLIAQTIPDPTIVQDPNDHTTFCGWIIDKPNYTKDDVKGDHTINYVRAAVAERLTDEYDPVVEGEVMRVYAMFFHYYVVSYIGENGDVVLYSEAIYSKDSPIDYTIQMAYSPTDPSQYRFLGWAVQGQPDVYENGDHYSLASDLVLRAKVQRGYWLMFDENPDGNHNGATYRPPVFCENGTVTTADRPANPELVGYTFDGWYRDKNFTQPFSFTGTLAAHTTVYAKWTPNATAIYTVLVWKQNIDGNGYDFVESIRLTGAVDANTSSAIVTSGSGNNSYVSIDGERKQYTGFHYKETTGDSTIARNNSSVVNVYYDRNQHTLTFQVPNGSFTRLSSTPTANDNNQDVYGYVSAGSAYDSDYNRFYWSTGYTKLYARYASSSATSRSWFFKSDSRTINGQTYYLWIPYNSDYYGSSSNSGYYYEPSGWTTIKTISMGYGQFIGDQFPITGTNGVTYSGGERWFPNPTTTNWQLPIVYIETMPDEDVNFHLNQVARPVKTMVMYVEALPGTDTSNANVSNDGEPAEVVTYNGNTYVLYNYVSAYYNGVSAEDYVDIPGFTKLCVTDNSNNTLTLHAVDNVTGQYYEWDTEKDATVRFYYTRNSYKILYEDGSYYNGNQELMTDVSSRGYLGESAALYYGADISSYNKNEANFFEPSYDGYIFEGWYLDKTGTQEADFDTMPLGGVTVYARWQKIQYRVFLHNNGGTYVDASQDSDFRINWGESVSEPAITRTGYELVGWFTDPGFTQPYNFKTKLTNDTVTAAYTDKLSSDVPRYWITRKLDLYAKWHKVLDGANGLTIVYNAVAYDTTPGNMGSAGDITWTDPLVYQDQADAIGRSASSPDDNEHYVFLYWEIMNPDGTPSGKFVYPGQEFTVDYDDAVMTPHTNIVNANGVPQHRGLRTFTEKTKTSNEPATRATETYEKVTGSSLEVGSKYLITYTTGNTAYIMGNTMYSSSADYLLAVSATVSSNTITGDYSAYLYTVEQSSGYYMFKNATTSQYFGLKSTTSAGLTINNTGTDLAKWSWSGTYMTSQGTNTTTGYPYLGSTTYDGTRYFRGVDSSTNRITVTFYKVNEASASGELDEALNVSGGELHFTSTGSYPWYVPSGQTYAESGNYHAASSDSVLTMDSVHLTAGSTLTFKYYAGSESQNYDYLYFKVNGTDQSNATNAFTHKGGSGMSGFATFTYTAAAEGDYVFSWGYTKDGSYNTDPDCARLDDVELTIASASNDITVTFDANGGSGTMANQTMPANTATALNANTFTRSGYSFASWNTARNGSGTSYADGQSVTLTADVTLYAQWTANASEDVTYKLVQTPVSGVGYILVADGSVSGTTGYAVTDSTMTNSSGPHMGATAVTVSSDKSTVTVPSSILSSIVWTPATSGSGYTWKASSGNYIGLSSGGYLQPDTTSRVWLYTSEKRFDNNQVIDAFRYMTYASENTWYTVSKSTSNSNVINLYARAYTLTVNYVMEDGTTPPAAQVMQVAQGESYSVPSPTVSGYTPSTATLSGTMPGRDYSVTVTYTKEETPSGGTEVWVPTNTIIPNEDYLIGLVVDGVTYLVLNYSNTYDAYYKNFTSTGGAYPYYRQAYAAPATIENSNVVAVTGEATDLKYATWQFSSSSGGTITADVGGETVYLYLARTGSSSSYIYWACPYSSSTSFTYNSTNHRLSSGSSYYVAYFTKSDVHYMDITNSSDNAAYIQLYHKEIVADTYTVTFYGWQGEVIGTPQTVSDGSCATAPTVTAPTNYVFQGWTKDDDTTTIYTKEQIDAMPITADTEFYAYFTTVSGKPVYTVIFVNWNGETISIQSIEEGGDAVKPADPTRPGYTFTGWDANFTGVHSDLVVNANFAREVTKDYTITVRAVYGPKVPIKLTHITWYANNGTGNKMDSEDVTPNAKINIELPKDEGGNAMFTWENHVFLGWARLDESDSEGHPITIGNQVALNEDNLFLKWDGSTKKFYAHVPENSSAWKEVTHVAADELLPYHGMYAVWAEVFYVYHSGTGKVEQIVRTTKAGTTFDLANRTSEGYLYGGYYKDYAGKSSNFNEKTMGWTAIRGIDDFTNSMNVQTKDDTGAKKYNGFNVKWDGSKAYRLEDGIGNGLGITPVAGQTYFIKEVPAAKYLRPYLHYTFYKTSDDENAEMPISTAWLISDVDDNNYSQAGFVIISANNEASVVKSLTVTTNTDPDNTITLTAMRIFGARGYLSYLTVIKDRYDGTDPISLLADGDRVAQYWVTPDGLIVTGTAERTYSSLANTSISANTLDVESVISVFNATNPSPVVKPGK